MIKKKPKINCNKLNSHHFFSDPPAVYIVAGPGIDSTSLHEGSEVNLTCEAHANPQPHKYNWFHDVIIL